MHNLDQNDNASRFTQEGDPKEAIALGATASSAGTDADAKAAGEVGIDAKNSQPADADATNDEQKSRSEILYDRFAEKSRELFEANHEKGREALDKAMDLAREQLAAAGEFSAEQGEQFKKFLRRDLEQTADDMRRLGQEAQERLHPSRVGAGALSSLARLMHATGDSLNSLSRKAEETLAYNTGELTTAGTLTCSACNQKVHLKDTGHVPPCPKCHSTRFRKSY